MYYFLLHWYLKFEIFLISNYINRYVNELNENYKGIIAYQYVLSGISICLTIYRQTDTTKLTFIEFCMMIFYLLSMMTQFFIYCSVGNYVKYKVTIINVKS